MMTPTLQVLQHHWLLNGQFSRLQQLSLLVYLDCVTQSSSFSVSAYNTFAYNTFTTRLCGESLFVYMRAASLGRGCVPYA
jgi:hypothetical protein